MTLSPIPAKIFNYCCSRGIINTNPMQATFTSNPKKRRPRLTLSQFKDVYLKAPEIIKRTMELSFIGLLGRMEIINARFDMIDDGKLFITRQKSELRGEHSNLAIEITPALQRTIDKCKLLVPGSPYLISKAPPNKRTNYITKKHPTQVTPRHICEMYSDVRDRLGYWNHLSPEFRPRLHEVRALGARMMFDKGVERKDISQLMAHKYEETTQVYLDGHQSTPPVDCTPTLDIGEILKKKG